MTGGIGGAGYSVELLLSDGTPWCTLPDLPGFTNRHTQSGLVACGGGFDDTSCVTFSEGQWRTSHSLLYPRTEHSAWSSTQHGTIHIGGRSDDSDTTTEVLVDNGESQGSFSLKYETM